MGGRGIRYHGDVHEEQRFHVLPNDSFDFLHKGVVRWRPDRDTFEAPQDFCKNCVFVRRLPHGEEVWQCLGHDCEGLGRDPGRTDMPPSFRDRPLKGKRMVEVFSGVPREGGCTLSEAWEDAGGMAVRYDIRIDEQHDFLEDKEFWENEEAHPADVYHFAIPCDNFSIAHTTPSKIRNLEYPLGWNLETDIANRIMRTMIRRIQILASKGAGIVIENPLMSYLWKIPECKD